MQFGSESLVTARHRGVLQIASGVAEALRLGKEGLWERLLGMEKARHILISLYACVTLIDSTVNGIGSCQQPPYSTV